MFATVFELEGEREVLRLAWFLIQAESWKGDSVGNAGIQWIFLNRQ
jgi:hypothetical protein